MLYINNFLVRSDKNFNLGVIKPDFSMDIEAIATLVDLKKHKKIPGELYIKDKFKKWIDFNCTDIQWGSLL